MSRSAAAFFDLDRTLLGGSSGEVFQRHLRAHGVGPDIDIPLVGLLNRAFGLVGETRTSMALARLSARAAKGWPVAAVRAAARDAVPDLLELLQPHAPAVLEEHRSSGRALVMATSSPTQLVEPLAEALAFDAVVATTWAERDGRFTGGIEGRFVWARGKWLSVRDWAREHDVAMARCYAYSDSYYDVPMLAGVGHPVAVNPDPRLTAVALLKGWPIRHLDAPPGVVKVGGLEVQELLRPFIRPELIPNARFEFTGLENIPGSGPAIVCGNHRSYFDPTALALLFAKAGRSARFLGKKEVFDAPVVGPMAAAMGGIRVDRGTGSAEPLDRAVEALRGGELVAIMPQGTIPRGPAFFDPELKGRWGAARLAAASGAPVIPVGLWGTEKVWPRSSRLPRLNPVSPPKVTVNVGPPVELTGADLDTDTKAIMSAIMDLLPPESRVRHDPTPEELALTYPPGYSGNPETETERRPGSD